MPQTTAPAVEPGARTSHERRMRAGTGMRLREEPAPVLALAKRTTVKSLAKELGEETSTPPTSDVALVAQIGSHRPIALTVVTSQRAALNQVRLLVPRAVFVEVDSRPQSRVRFCRMLRNRAPGTAIVALGDKPPDGPFEFDDFAPLPLTRQRTEAVLGRLRDGDAPQALVCGPFRLYVSERTVESPNGTSHLTPKLTALLEYLILHCNQIVPRSDIMESIWQTSYLDDTRTLDVHVRWLRESIEPDPSSPRYLLTERGVGYYLKCG